MAARHPSRIALAIMVMGWAVSPATAAPRYRFDMPAAPIRQGIAAIGDRAGIDVAIADPALLAIGGHALHFTGTARQALDRLLDGSRARAISSGPGTWRIVARPPRRAPAPPVAKSEIIVSASKQSAPLARYPASIAVIGGDLLPRFGAAPDTEALADEDPTLQSTHLGSGRNKLFLRGIADSSFNGSSGSLVGLYLGDLRLTYNAPDPNLRLYDVAQTEILQGPQGTLYGSGALAGLVRVTPKAPDPAHVTGEAWLGASNTAHGAPGGDIGGILNLPLIPDRLALRMVGYAAQDGGYIDDPTLSRKNGNRTRTQGGRAALRYRIGDDWFVQAGLIAQDVRNADAQYADAAAPPLTRSSPIVQPSRDLYRAGEFILSGPIGGATFTATTGIVRQTNAERFDATQSPDQPTAYDEKDRVRLLSQEARLAGGGGAISWVGGMSLLSSRTVQVRTLSRDGETGSLGRVVNRLTDITAYAEVTGHPTGRLAITVGGRTSHVRLSGSATGALQKAGPDGPHIDGSRREAFLVPSLAIAWTPRRPLLLFTRYAQGYRPGGLTSGGALETFDADRMDTIETGLRLTPAASSRLSATVSLSDSWWHDVQADYLAPTGLPYTRNIGNARIRAVTASGAWRMLPGLKATLGATFTHGAVRGPDLDGTIVQQPLPNVARDSLIAALDYRTSLAGDRALELALHAHHVGRSTLGAGLAPRQGDYTLLSAGARLDLGALSVLLDISNLLDSRANIFAFGTPLATIGYDQITPPRPRTIRIGLTRRL